MRRLKDLFVRASRLAEAERAAFVDTECGDDDALRRELVALLDAETSLTEDDLPAPEGHGLGTIVPPDITDPVVGRTIGPYVVVKPLGVGGMGRVYQAERRDEFHQVVAIKLVREGMESEDILRRFNFERQALAALDHPNIAHLLGGGDDDGKPYFVMEYVEGVPLHEYCDGRRLSLTERLELFATVAGAVGHAHDHTIVHRDLKPANVLVTKDGTPKLLDFGLARLAVPELSAARLDRTRADRRFMTVTYASPEQLLGDVVGKPSDVYSLGVMLYELVSGHRPYWLDGLTWGQIEHQVCYVVPPRPSSAVSRVVKFTREDGARVTISPQQVAADRGTDPHALWSALRGDLDTIVMKALRKEPSERYADAGALAADVRRLLAQRPIAAQDVTIWYRTTTFVKRNRTVVTLTAALILALTAGLAGTTILWRQAIEQGKENVELERRAMAAESFARSQAARSFSKRLAAIALSGLEADPDRNLMLAIAAVRMSDTVMADWALRTTLLERKPDIVNNEHTAWVQSAAFSPDGTRIVSASDDGVVFVWDQGSGDVLLTLVDPSASGPVRDARFSPNGARIVTAHDDGRARIWDATTGRLQRTLAGHEGPVLKAGFSADGKWIGTSGEDGKVLIWDARRDAPPVELHRWDRAVHSAEWGADPEHVIVGLAGGTAEVRDRRTDALIAELIGHDGPVLDAEFSPNGTRIVTASSDGSARVWDLSGAQLHILPGHVKPVAEASFSPDGRWIVTAGDDEMVRVWDAETGEMLRVQGGHTAAFSPDGQWLVVADGDDGVSVVPWEMFAPIDYNLREATTKVSRELTEDELRHYLRNLTPGEEVELRKILADRFGFG